METLAVRSSQILLAFSSDIHKSLSYCIRINSEVDSLVEAEKTGTIQLGVE
jgi:hypothetical protein